MQQKTGIFLKNFGLDAISHKEQKKTKMGSCFFSPLTNRNVLDNLRELLVVPFLQLEDMLNKPKNLLERLCFSMHGL